MTDLLDPLLPITVTIDTGGGARNVTSYYVTRSLAITKTLGQELDTCRLALIDHDGNLDTPSAPAGWERLVVTESGYGSTLFTGFIVSLRRTVQQGGQLRWDLTALDTGVLLQKVVVDKTYQNLTRAAILSDLAATYAPWLDVVTHVAATATLYSERFDRVSLSECIKIMAEADGYEWWLDDDELYFISPDAVAGAPFGVADYPQADFETTFPYVRGSLEVASDFVDVRNRVSVHGGTRASAPQTEVFTGDGATTEFTVVHAPVHVYIAVYVAGVSQRFGREFIDDPGTYAILTNWQHGIVRFATAPAVGAEIQVVYTYNDPVRVTVVDNVSAAVYCPAAYLDYFEHVHVDGKLTTQTAAEAVALTILGDYAYGRSYGRVTVPKLGLLPGQSLLITDATLGWSASPRLIRSVQINEIKAKVFETVVSFGNRQPSLLDTLLGLAGGAGGIAAGVAGGQGDVLAQPQDLRQPTGYQYVTLASGENILVPVYHELVGTGLDFSDANNSQYVTLF